MSLCALCPVRRNPALGNGPFSCGLAATGDLFVEQRDLTARQVLSVAVRRPDRIAIIRRGWAYSYRMTEQGDRHIEGIHTAGDILGIRNVLGSPVEFSARALTDMSLCILDRDVFMAKIREDDAYNSVFMAMLDRNFWRMSNVIAELTHKTARERLCRALLRTGLFLRSEIRNYVEEIPLTQEIFAELLGMSKVHTNRVLTDLRREDICHLGHGFLSITNYEKLIEEAQLSPGEMADWKRYLTPVNIDDFDRQKEGTKLRH